MTKISVLALILMTVAPAAGAVDRAVLDLAVEVRELRTKIDQVELQVTTTQGQANRYIETAVTGKVNDAIAKTGGGSKADIEAIVRNVMESQADIVAGAVSTALAPLEARLTALEAASARRVAEQAELTVMLPVPNAERAQELYRMLPGLGYAERVLVPRGKSWSLHVGPFKTDEAARAAAATISDAAQLRAYVIDAQGGVR